MLWFGRKPVTTDVSPGGRQTGPAPVSDPVRLDHAVSALLEALIEAQNIANRYSDELAAKEEETGKLGQVPRVQIGTVNLALQIAVVGPEKTGVTETGEALMVYIDSEYLKRMPPKSVSTLNLALQVSSLELIGPLEGR